MDWRLLPSELWWAAMEWLDGSQSDDRQGLLPGFLTEEAQLCATPRPRFPTSRSQALSVSEVRKRPSYASPKKKSEISRAPWSDRSVVFVYQQPYITLRNGRDSALRLMNSAGRLWAKSLFFFTAIAKFRSRASISSVLRPRRGSGAPVRRNLLPPPGAGGESP